MGNDPIQGGGRGTYVALETSSTMGRWDRPPRREAQGDGAAVVLGGRESRGKGGRCPETRTGRSARCALPKPYWESSTTAASEDCRWRTSIDSCSTPSSICSPTVGSPATRGP